MGIWQRSMIALALNKPLARLVQGQPMLAALSGRFVGGSNLAETVQMARKLKSSGKLASLFYLGEYVSDPERIARTVREYEAAAPAMAAADLDVHLSVDPTAIGALIGEQACRDNAFRIARAIAGAAETGGLAPERSFLMLDMEDSSVTESTIRLYEDLREAGLPAAVTLQAYLHLYERDVKRCIVPGGRIRLVKGALAEPASVAATTRADIDRRYRWAAEMMLSPEAREMGTCPIFATHDVPMIRHIRATARRNGWEPGRYEFEMLYGVRPRLQDALVAVERLRLYLPFGEDWWPYAIRRVGENPRNVPLLMKALLNSR